MAIDWKALTKDKKVLAAAGVGGGLGLYVYVKRKRQAGAGGATTADTGQPVAGAVGDSGAVDAYNNLQSELENLQGQITALYGGAPLPTAQQAVAPPTPTSAGFALHRIGTLGGTYNLRDIARRFAPNPSSPNSVEAELRRLVAANPALKGKTSLPGGFALKVPG